LRHPRALPGGVGGKHFACDDRLLERADYGKVAPPKNAKAEVDPISSFRLAQNRMRILNTAPGRKG